MRTTTLRGLLAILALVSMQTLIGCEDSAGRLELPVPMRTVVVDFSCFNGRSDRSLEITITAVDFVSVFEDEEFMTTPEDEELEELVCAPEEGEENDSVSVEFEVPGTEMIEIMLGVETIEEPVDAEGPPADRSTTLVTLNDFPSAFQEGEEDVQFLISFSSAEMEGELLIRYLPL